MKFSFRYNNERKKLIENFFSLSVLQVLSYVFLPLKAYCKSGKNVGKASFYKDSID